jgi:tetratricopeptide (TPR) repeat protein
LDRLRSKAAQGRPFVLILGASGSGKSSLAMAGVLPLLVKPGTIEGVGLWRRVVFRPGGQTEVGDLFDRLAAALVRQQHEGEGLPELISGSTTVEQLAADLRADPKAAALLVRSALNQVAVLYREAEAQKLRSWIAASQAENRTADVERYGRLLADLTPRESRLALVIDQAEELFTSDDLNRRPELRKGFAVALDAFAASGVVFVLMTLRSDFYSQIQQLPAFVDLKDADGQFDLLPAQPAEIAQMIRQPAIAAGLRFEKDERTQEGLDEVLADQVKAEPRLLPLLEFALDELYKQRSADGLLTFGAYRVHLDGSIVRALAKRANATLEGLPELSRDAFCSVMRRLATTVDDTAAGSVKGPQLDVIEKGSSGPAFQRQRVPYDQLTAYPPGAKALVDAFVAARLLVVEKGKADDQAAEVTVAHEALFEHWAALKNLLLAERDDLILPRARVAVSHERWLAENRAGDFLLPPGKQLSEAEQLLAEYGEELTPELKAYVAASMTQAHAQEKRRQRLLVGALVVFALLAVGATAAAFFGFWQKDQAEKQTRLAVDAERIAKQQLEEAARSDRLVAEDKLQGGKNADALAYLARASRYTPKSSLSAEAATPDVLSPPIASIASFQGHTAGVVSAVFSPDGRRVLTASRDYSARLWEAESGKLLATFQGHTGQVTSAVFSPDGRRVLTASLDNSARLWEAESGKLLATFQGPTAAVVSAVFSPDGRRVLTASNDKTARLWETESGKLLAAFQGHTAAVVSAVFSPDGRRVLTASWDNSARLWEAESGKLLATFQGHTGWLASAVFSPDGRQVLTASSDNSARLWETESGQLLATFQGHTDVVESAVFSPDGRRVLTASRDYSARLWPVLLVGVPPPDWCSDFLVWLGGKRIAPNGQIETLSGDELLKLEAQLRPHMNEDTDCARLLRWRLLPLPQRPVDPYDTTTQQQAADLIIRPDMNEYEARHAYDLDPWHPLVHLALAGFEEDPIRADFLRRYSLDRLPNDAKLRQRAAEFLREQGIRTEGVKAAELLAEAVVAYRSALEVYTREQFPQDWAITQNNLGLALTGQGIRTEGAKAAELLAEAVAAYRSALDVRSREQFPQDWAATQYNLGDALKELGTRSGAEEGRKLLQEAVAAYRSALEVRTKADLPQDWALTQNNLSDALEALGNQLEGEEGLKRQRESVELLRGVASYQPDDLSRYRLASALGSLAFNLVLDSRFAEAQARCEEAQRLANQIVDDVEKTDRDNLIFIQGNLAHALFFQGHYDEALAIYRQYWDKPLNGKTFGEVTLEDFAAFDKAGLTHPDLSRMKRALGDLRSKAPNP